MIVVENLGVRFVVPVRPGSAMPGRTLRRWFSGDGNHMEIWALRGVNFSVSPGQSVAVVGRNGSGKTTLLRCLAGILEPTEGRMEIAGRRVSVLELGTGFNPELTGRENVYVNGSLLGMDRKEIAACLPEIEELSGLGSFLDVPLRHYSGGMCLRLGFSIASSARAEVLLLDEVFLVGDLSFQKKCFARLRQLEAEGTTVLFATHDLALARTLAEHALLLEEGNLLAEGSVDQVIPRYYEVLDRYEKGEPETVRAAQSGADHERGQRESLPSLERSRAREIALKRPRIQRLSRVRYGSGEVEVLGVEVCDPFGKARDRFELGEGMLVRVRYRAKERVRRPEFGISFYHEEGIHVSGPNNNSAQYPIEEIEGEGVVECRLSTLPLVQGRYFVTVAVHDETALRAFDYVEQAAAFEVFSEQTDEVHGLLYIPHRWKIEPKEGGIVRRGKQ